jgi:hypothetical protein
MRDLAMNQTVSRITRPFRQCRGCHEQRDRRVALNDSIATTQEART